MPSPAEIVQRYQAAIGEKNFSAARKLLHDSFHFQGPIDTFDRPEPYLEALQKLSAIVIGMEHHKTFVDGNDVCVLYDLNTKIVPKSFVSEWFRVKGDRIASIRVVFDARPFAPAHPASASR